MPAAIYLRRLSKQHRGGSAQHRAKRNKAAWRHQKRNNVWQRLYVIWRKSNSEKHQRASYGESINMKKQQSGNISNNSVSIRQ